MTSYRILGTSNDVTTCDCCGRTDLKLTVVVGTLDTPGGAVMSEAYYGTTCAARATGAPSKRIKKAIDRLAEAKRAAKRAAMDRHPIRAEMTRLTEGYAVLSMAPAHVRARIRQLALELDAVGDHAARLAGVEA